MLEFLDNKLTNTKIPIILFTVCLCVYIYIYIYILKVKTGDGLTSLFTIQKPRLEFLESKLTNTKIPIILFTVCMCVSIYIYIYYILKVKI